MRLVVPNFQGELTLHQDLLLYGRRIVVPKCLQKETLLKVLIMDRKGSKDVDSELNVLYGGQGFHKTSNS